jgi:hypothetical protein
LRISAIRFQQLPGGIGDHDVESTLVPQCFSESVHAGMAQFDKNSGTRSKVPQARLGCGQTCTIEIPCPDDPTGLLASANVEPSLNQPFKKAAVTHERVEHLDFCGVTGQGLVGLCNTPR